MFNCYGVCTNSELNYLLESITHKSMQRREYTWIGRCVCLNRVLHESWTFSMRAENLHDVLSHKPISEELIDTSGCIRKCFFYSFYLCKWHEKHPASNIERVTQYSFHFGVKNVWTHFKSVIFSGFCVIFCCCLDFTIFFMFIALNHWNSSP